MNMISVIVPAYNAECYIEDCLLSVLRQSYADLEIIVVDDASTDGTLEKVIALQKSDQRIRLVELGENSGGPAKPRNVGLKLAEGELIAFIDSDDIWHPEKLKIQINTLNHARLGMISCRRRRFVRTADIEADDSFRCDSDRQFAISRISYTQLLKKNKLVASGVLMTRQLAEQLEFSESREHVAIEDYLAWLNLLKRSNNVGGIVECPLVYYRVRSDSLSTSSLLMAKKVWRLLAYLDRTGELGLFRRLWYFAHYGVQSLLSRVRD